jgi:hypothetical protein
MYANACLVKRTATVHGVSDRFFYHSFPRRGRDTDREVEIGCKMLALMCNGLVLTPEVVKWEYPHADGSPPRKMDIQQKRVCFTELSPDELPRHADEFGHFALEFEIDVLKGLGAIPVFYIPKGTGRTGEVTALGSVLVIQLIDAMVLAMRLAGVKKNLDDAPFATGQFPCTFGFTETKLQTFNLDVLETRKYIEAFTYSLTPPDMLEHSLTALLSFFYPADDIERNKALAYYRQREWRIVGNLAIRGEELMRRPSTEFIGRLLEIDSEFFGRELASGNRRADECYVYPGIGEKRLIEMVRRIIVPDAAVERAKSIVNCVGQPPPIIAFSAIERQRDENGRVN